MKIIQQLSDNIDEEILDAEKYAREALLHKDDDRKLADVYARLSEEELGHMQRLHDAVAQIIQEYRQKNGEPPAEMLAVYNYLHERQIDHVSDVKRLQDIYKKN